MRQNLPDEKGLRKIFQRLIKNSFLLICTLMLYIMRLFGAVYCVFVRHIY